MRIKINILTHEEAQSIMAGWAKDSWFEDVPFMPRWVAALIGGLRRRVNRGWSRFATNEVFIDGGVWRLFTNCESMCAKEWHNIDGVATDTHEVEIIASDMKDSESMIACGQRIIKRLNPPSKLIRYSTNEGESDCLAKLIMHEIYHLYHHVGNEGHVWKLGYLMFPSRVGRGWKV